MTVSIRYKKMHPNARKLEKTYKDSVGYDAFPVESGVIPPRTKVNIRLGFAAAFDVGYVARFADRSGMGNKSQTFMGGVIDPDYRDEWQVIIYNATDVAFNYGPEKAIIQVLFVKCEELQDVAFEPFSGSDPEGWFSSLPDSERGLGKFGSTDKQGVTDRVSLSLGSVNKMS